MDAIARGSAVPGGGFSQYVILGHAYKRGPKIKYFSWPTGLSLALK